ncbi:hypothetical protein VPH35_124849 [Triticum aestivum]
MNVQKSFGARFVLLPFIARLIIFVVLLDFFQAAQVVIDLVQSRNKDKHKLFVEWSQSLIIDVLDCLSHSSLNVKSVPTSEALSLFSIHSFIAERNFETVVDNPSPQVERQIPNLSLLVLFFLLLHCYCMCFSSF